MSAAPDDERGEHEISECLGIDRGDLAGEDDARQRVAADDPRAVELVKLVGKLEPFEVRAILESAFVDLANRCRNPEGLEGFVVAERLARYRHDGKPVEHVGDDDVG